jgi:hypothetical protein
MESPEGIRQRSELARSLAAVLAVESERRRRRWRFAAASFLVILWISVRVAEVCA